MTVIEVLPKEKKQKEEKITPLGQATVDLLPLLKGIFKFVPCKPSEKCNVIQSMPKMIQL